MVDTNALYQQAWPAMAPEGVQGRGGSGVPGTGRVAGVGGAGAPSERELAAALVKGAEAKEPWARLIEAAPAQAVPTFVPMKMAAPKDGS